MDKTMLNAPLDLPNLLEYLHAVNCPRQLERVRGMVERAQQLRRFPDCRSMDELKSRLPGKAN